MMKYGLILAAFLTASLQAGTAEISFTNNEITQAKCDADTAIMFEGELLKVKVNVDGLKRRGLKYTYYWTTAGFKDNVSGVKANSKRIRRSTTTIRLPELQRNTESTTLIVSVRARNVYGDEAVASKSVRVWRQFYLGESSGRQCLQVLSPELISGMYTNNTNASRTINHSDKSIWSQSASKGGRRGWGLNLSPSYAGISLFSFGKNRDYMWNKGQSVETHQTSSVTTELFPGEAAFFFRQTTLLRRHFSVYMVDRCETSRTVGDAFYHNSVYTYPVALVDAQAANPLKELSVGAIEKDTCKDFESSVSDNGEDAFITPEDGEVPFEIE